MGTEERDGRNNAEQRPCHDDASNDSYRTRGHNHFQERMLCVVLPGCVYCMGVDNAIDTNNLCACNRNSGRLPSLVPVYVHWRRNRFKKETLWYFLQQKRQYIQKEQRGRYTRTHYGTDSRETRTIDRTFKGYVKLLNQS